MAMILMEIPQDEFTVEDVRQDPRGVCSRLHKIAKDDIEDQLSDPEAYVPEMYPEDDPECILGAIDPERLQEAAMKWNSDIRDNLLQAIGTYILAEGSRVATPAELLDTAATYGLKKAAIAADNSFFDFAEHFVNLPNENGFPYLRTQIGQRDLAKIMATPERYAIVPVYVK